MNLIKLMSDLQSLCFFLFYWEGRSQAADYLARAFTSVYTQTSHAHTFTHARTRSHTHSRISHIHTRAHIHTFTHPHAIAHTRANARAFTFIHTPTLTHPHANVYALGGCRIAVSTCPAIPKRARWAGVG